MSLLESGQRARLAAVTKCSEENGERIVLAAASERIALILPSASVSEGYVGRSTRTDGRRDFAADSATVSESSQRSPVNRAPVTPFESSEASHTIGALRTSG